MLGGRFDCIATPHARKLSGLALCQLLTLPLPVLLDRLELIAACVTSVWYEVQIPAHPVYHFTIQQMWRKVNGFTRPAASGNEAAGYARVN